MPDPPRPLPQTDQLAADLSDLRALAQVDLRGIEEIYAGLNQNIGDTAGNDAAAFSGYNGGASAAVQELGAAWTGARNLLHDAFTASVNSLHLAGEAVMSIAASYGAADTAARDRVDAAWKNGIPANEVLYPEESRVPSSAPAPTTSR